MKRIASPFIPLIRVQLRSSVFSTLRHCLTLTAVVMLLGLLPTTSVCAADDPAYIERLRQRLSSGVLKWGGDAEASAPYQLRDPANPERVIGFEVEIADALVAEIARRIDRPLKAQFVQYNWVSLEPGLQETKDFDMILAGFEKNADNVGRVAFTRGYYVYGQQLVVRADETRIKSLADCVDLRVATLAGALSDRILQEAGVKQIVGFDTQVEPYRDLELGRVDAALLDYPIYTFYAAPNPRLKAACPATHQNTYHAALRLEDRDLTAAVDDALSQLMIRGTLRDIFRKWRLWNADQRGLPDGKHREAELLGLGFDAQGQPVDPATLPPVQEIPRDMIAESSDHWTFDVYFPVLLRAAGMTVQLTFASMAVAMAIGLLVAVSRLYGPAPLRHAALCYVEFFRGIPLLLVLYFIYYGAPNLGFEISAIPAAILGFGIVYAAYEAEVYRSAIESVPRGQWEAGRALGMADVQVFRRVIFPQAFRTALGPMTNDFVAMFKDTSLVSVIAVQELTKEYLVLARSSFKFVELGLLTAALYMAMSIPLGYLSRYLERRWGPKR